MSSVIEASSALRCLSVMSPSRVMAVSRILMLTSWSEVSTPAELSMASVLMCTPDHEVNIDRKSTRLNSSHANIYTLSLHDALPICRQQDLDVDFVVGGVYPCRVVDGVSVDVPTRPRSQHRSEEHTSELQSRQYLHSFPTRRSSDLPSAGS